MKLSKRRALPGVLCASGRHLALAIVLFARFASAEAMDPQAVIELHWPGKVLAGEDAQQRVLSKALQVLRSSNFHSGPGDDLHLFKVPEVQREYRKEVAGRFLVISFPTARWITTVGGEIMVGEIVIGLNGEQYASSLFTIDESGHIVGHAKYSGTTCVELLQLVRDAT